MDDFSKITWLDLYNFLHRTANDINNLGSFDWNGEVKVLNPQSGSAHLIETDSSLLSKGLIGYYK
jgi:hypothetical protein